eukprot:5597278-Pyramimonas_sp.AAC.1
MSHAAPRSRNSDSSPRGRRCGVSQIIFNRPPLSPQTPRRAATRSAATASCAYTRRFQRCSW